MTLAKVGWLMIVFTLLSVGRDIESTGPLSLLSWRTWVGTLLTVSALYLFAAKVWSE